MFTVSKILDLRLSLMILLPVIVKKGQALKWDCTHRLVMTTHGGIDL